MQDLLSPQERYAAGRRLRFRVPRSRHAHWDVVATDGVHRLSVLDAVNEGRLATLLPEKQKRMGVSPFTFFRGAAALMAHDLATLPRTGLTTQLCGDAHVQNLGAYSAPDGTIVFDINDFDETIPGPWEWDVKRLATSLVLAGEEAGQSLARSTQSVRVFVASYRVHLRAFAAMPFAKLARYLIARRSDEPVLGQILRQAKRVTPLKNLRKLTVAADGAFRFHDSRPDLEHVPTAVADQVLRGLRAYRATLIPSRRRTLDRYRPIDVAFKLVGTGSVGTRDYVVLLFGNGQRDPLFLQVKQELPSCYCPYVRVRPSHGHEGRRVAEGQQMMQTLSDPFLGYTRFGEHDYLVRQLADHKARLDTNDLPPRTLFEYARLCGEALAKGHARTTDAARLAGYVGRAEVLDEAIAAFAVAYAQQTAIDFQSFSRNQAAPARAVRRARG